MSLPVIQRPVQRIRFMEILSHAKINLFLRIVGRRPDGYHDLVSLMCPVSLYDRMTVVCDGGWKGVSVRCDHPDVPRDTDNLAGKAALAFQELYGRRTGREMGGVRITIQKKIPVGAGLGGGSSNAASVLTALNRHFGRPLPRDDILDAAAGIGADVPFFIDCQPALATGIGDRLTPCPGLPGYALLLVNPGFSVSTASVYKSLNLALTNCKKKHNYFNFKAQFFDVERHLCNDLESVAAVKFPEIFDIKAELKSAGAINALMSGSGPTVFGLFSGAAAARRARYKLEKHHDWQVIPAYLMTGDKVIR